MTSELKLVRRAGADGFAGELAAASSDRVRIEPVPFRQALNLRAQPGEELATAVLAALGVALPLEPNRWNNGGGRAAAWLGPDEWLLLAPDGESQPLAQAIRRAWPDDPWLALTDVSHSYTSFRLSGTGARDVLAGGCPLDLHPGTFGPGSCAQTLLAKVPVLLLACDDGASLELCFRNSFARYVADWLVDAC